MLVTTVQTRRADEISDVYFLILPFLAVSCDDDGPTIIDHPGYAPTPYNLEFPAYMPIMDLPEDNLMTEEGVTLGRMLFYDPILSGDSTLSCAGCHKANYSFSDERQFSIGIDGSVGTSGHAHREYRMDDRPVLGRPGKRRGSPGTRPGGEPDRNEGYLGQCGQ